MNKDLGKTYPTKFSEWFRVEHDGSDFFKCSKATICPRKKKPGLNKDNDKSDMDDGDDKDDNSDKDWAVGGDDEGVRRMMVLMTMTTRVLFMMMNMIKVTDGPC